MLLTSGVDDGSFEEEFFNWVYCVEIWGDTLDIGQFPESIFVILECLPGAS